MSTRHPGVIAAVAGIVSIPVGIGASWLAAAYSPDAKNTLAQLGLALPERAADSGMTLGSDPAVVIGATAWLTWAGVAVLVAGIAFVLGTWRYGEAEAENDIEMPDVPGIPPQQQQQQMMGQPMMGQQMGMYPPQQPMMGHPMGQQMPPPMG